MELERLLRSQGFGSRAECRSLIEQGRVVIAGHRCDDPLAELAPDGLHFTVDGGSWVYRHHVYLAMHKPAGYECSHRPSHHPGVHSLLPYPLLKRRVQAVGRLDVDTTGLLLLSDDGHFIHAYTSPRKQVPKVYEVTARHPIDERQLSALLGGVLLHGESETVRATECVLLSEKRLRLTLTQGKYHLVKRMVAAAGNRVEALHRSAIGGLSLPPQLKVGEWMWLESTELERLAWRR